MDELIKKLKVNDFLENPEAREKAIVRLSINCNSLLRYSTEKRFPYI